MTMAARIANYRKTAMSMFPNMVIIPMMAIASARTAVAGPLMIDFDGLDAGVDLPDDAVDDLVVDPLESERAGACHGIGGRGLHQDIAARAHVATSKIGATASWGSTAVGLKVGCEGTSGV